MRTAQVALSGATADYDRLYTYLVPARLEGHIFVGSVVLVPFGRGERAPRVGVVVEQGEDPGDDVLAGEAQAGKARAGLKELLDAAPPETRLTDELVAIVRYLREATFCTWYEAVRAVLPHGAQHRPQRTETGWALQAHIRRHSETVYALCGGAAGGTPFGSSISAPPLSNTRCARVCPAPADGGAASSALDDVRAADAEQTAKPLTAKQQLVMDALADGPLPKAELLACCGVGPGVLDTLCKRGQIVAAQQDRAVVLDDFLLDGQEKPSAAQKQAPAARQQLPQLSPAQAQVAKELLARMGEDLPKPALLYGVTGSGKTSVFLHLVQAALDAGRTALVLVPEIGLTPQMIGQLRAAFGPAVAVQHSGLSHTERLLQWRAVRAGAARVVVGTRSAVFAPLDDIGLIVVDEEQERSYQSEQSPRYDAIEVARRRAGRHGALLLLASATPSVASYYGARAGRYTLHTLHTRYAGVPLPQVELVDMHDELMEGNAGLVSRRLAQATGEALAAGRQAIYLLNRRGYHRVGVCRACNTVLKCPDCSVPMVYHRGRGGGAPGRQAEGDAPSKAQAAALPADTEPAAALSLEETKNLWKRLAAETQAPAAAKILDEPEPEGAEEVGPGGRLLCHYCGHSLSPAPEICPECGGQMRYMGFGTQRLEEELAALFPDARVLRMDMDSTTRRGAHVGMLRAFGRGEYDILLGTQMVAKGLDFERVGLVGVIGIDSLLFAQGYRAYEQVFSLVTQVVGRSGRPGADGAAQRGVALIQSMDVGNPVLTLAAKQDYEAFYEQEIEFRRHALYPPLCGLCVVGFSAPVEAGAMASARAFAGFLASRAAEQPDIPLRVLGPAPMNVAQVAGSWRWRLTLKCRADAPFRALLQAAMDDWRRAGWSKKSALWVDFNADNI